MPGYFLSHIEQRLVDDGLDERHAASAPCSCLGARLDFADILACASFDALYNVTFRDIVAGTDLCVVIPNRKSESTLSPASCDEVGLTDRQRSPLHPLPHPG